MKFKIKKNILDNILTTMQPFLDKKDDSNITSHIYMSLKDTKLIFIATDYEIYLSKQIEIDAKGEDGQATINGKNILNITKRLNENDISIETIDSKIKIKQNRSNFILPMYDSGDFPILMFDNLPEILNINSIYLVNALQKITPSIDTNNPKYTLNGALIDIKSSKINFVSTDTKRLSIIKMENMSNKESQIIVPKKAIEQITKLFLDDIEIYSDESNLTITTKDTKFNTKLISGDYASYERIIPDEFKHRIKLNKAMLIESIKLITILSYEIKIEFNQDEIVFNSIDENNKSQTKLDIKLDIDDNFYIALNSRYILDFLTVSSNSEIDVCFNESNLPFMLEDEKLKTIIMPIILD